MKNKSVSMIIGAMAGLANGLFGSGGGAIVVTSSRKFLGFERSRAHACAVAAVLPMAVVSACLYAAKTEIDWIKTGYISLFGMAGGYIGARLLKKVPAKWLRRLFGSLLIVSALKFIL